MSFRRRRYYDRVNKRWVYPLDELLEIPDARQVSPGLSSWAMSWWLNRLIFGTTG
ncbi:MAG: hypothetical protein DIU76_11950 [Bacillota bacterium]|nr:MAG: hypothetical protein DIU76_11950 [Bacillota bacterium]